MPVRGDIEDFNSLLRLFCRMALGKSFRQPFSAVDGKKRKKKWKKNVLGSKEVGAKERTGKQQINLLIVFWIDR